MKRTLRINPENNPATWPEIRDWRDRHEIAPVDTNFGPFDCDERSEARMAGSIEQFDNLPTLDVQGKLTWKRADNSYLPVTKAELTIIYDEIKRERAKRGALLHVKAEQFKALDPRPSPAELSNLAFWLG